MTKYSGFIHNTPLLTFKEYKYQKFKFLLQMAQVTKFYYKFHFSNQKIFQGDINYHIHLHYLSFHHHIPQYQLFESHHILCNILNLHNLSNNHHYIHIINILIYLFQHLKIYKLYIDLDCVHNLNICLNITKF